MSASSDPVLEARALGKDYRDGSRTLTVLDGLDFTAHSGETVAVVGQSGCGKTTLLQCLGLLDRPTRGSVLIQGVSASTLGEGRRTALRARHIGFVFQHYPLLGDFSAWENVALAGRLAGLRRPRARAAEWLDRVGLGERMGHRPSALSGGERQRCAVARALIHDPALLLCDEPTGNLDEATGASVMALFSGLAAERKTAVVLVTHEKAWASRADRCFRLAGGALHPQDAEEGAGDG